MKFQEVLESESQKVIVEIDLSVDASGFISGGNLCVKSWVGPKGDRDQGIKLLGCGLSFEGMSELASCVSSLLNTAIHSAVCRMWEQAHLYSAYHPSRWPCEPEKIPSGF